MITAISSNCEVCCPLLPPTKKNSPLTKKKVFFKSSLCLFSAYNILLLTTFYFQYLYLSLLEPPSLLLAIRLWNKPGLRFKVFEWFWRFQVCFWWRNLGSSIERLPHFFEVCSFLGRFEKTEFLPTLRIAVQYQSYIESEIMVRVNLYREN